MNCTDDPDRTCRLFIVDDHPLVRRSMRGLLDLEPDFEVVGEADSAERALELLAEPLPDLVLVDYSLPGMNGVELVQRLGASYPGLYCLVVSSHHERFYVDAALATGARGYVLKGEPDALLRAVVGVLRGETVVETA